MFSGIVGKLPGNPAGANSVELFFYTCSFPGDWRCNAHSNLPNGRSPENDHCPGGIIGRARGY
jgi:hypothetical protein